MKITPDLYLLHHMYEKHGYNTTHFDELVEELDGIMTKLQVSSALNTIRDWGLLEWEYGETKPGWAGRLYYLDSKYATKYLFESKPLNLTECEVQGSVSTRRKEDEGFGKKEQIR